MSRKSEHRNTRDLLLALVAAHAAVFAAVVAMAAENGPAFQVEIFRDYAEKIAAARTPYAGFAYEYPPLSLPLLMLPRLLASDPSLYAVLFGAEMLLLDIIILAALARVGKVPLLLYGIGLLLFWRVPYIRHDLAPVALATLGALLVLRGRYLWAAALWGLGGAVKLYPMVAVPALAAGASLREAARRWLVALAVFAAGILWGVAAFGREALMFFSYHADRPAMVESVPANLLLLFSPDARVTHGYGSFNVVGAFGEELVAIFEPLQLALTLLALVVVWWQGRGSEPRAVTVRGAAAATLAFSIFGKVFAWHYLFWPLPLLAIATGLGMVRAPKATWGLYFAAVLLTTAINETYWTIEENLPLFTAMLTARNLLLLPLFVLVLLPPREEDQQRERPAARDERVR